MGEWLVHALHIACPLAIVLLFATIPAVRLLTQVKSKRSSYIIAKKARNTLLFVSPIVCLTFVRAFQSSVFLYKNVTYVVVGRCRRQFCIRYGVDLRLQMS